MMPDAETMMSDAETRGVRLFTAMGRGVPEVGEMPVKSRVDARRIYEKTRTCFKLPPRKVNHKFTENARNQAKKPLFAAYLPCVLENMTIFARSKVSFFGGRMPLRYARTMLRHQKINVAA